MWQVLLFLWIFNYTFTRWCQKGLYYDHDFLNKVMAVLTQHSGGRNVTKIRDSDYIGSRKISGDNTAANAAPAKLMRGIVQIK